MAWGRSVRLRRGIAYAIIEICSVACWASPERLTNEKAAWVTSGYMGLGGWWRRVGGKISNPKYPAVAFLLIGVEYPPMFSFQRSAGLRLHVARVLL